MAKILDPVHQVGTELVASFQHTQDHNGVVAQVIHDVSGEALCSEYDAEKKKKKSVHAVWH